MKTIVVSKAQDISPERPIESCCIEISSAIPQIGTPETMVSHRLHMSKMYFRDQAVRIVDALQASLPGGTLDQVLCELLKRKASTLYIPQTCREPERETT